MTTLTRDQILESVDLKTATVEVPEWGGTVTIRTMTGADRDSFEQTLVVTDDKGGRKTDLSNMRAKLVAMTVIDDDGNRVFSEGDIGRLGKKSATALARIFDAAQVLNGMADSSEGDATKNSEADPSGVSTSGSH